MSRTIEERNAYAEGLRAVLVLARERKESVSGLSPTSYYGASNSDAAEAMGLLADDIEEMIKKELMPPDLPDGFEVPLL